MRFAWQCLPLFSVNYLVTNLCNAWLKKMQHNIFIFFYYSDNCTLSYHFNLFFLFILLVYFVLMWCDGTAGVGLSTSSGFGSDLSLWTGVLSWGAGRAGAHSRRPHCWPEQPVSNLLWNEEREDWSEPEALTTVRRRAFRETNSKFESIHLKGCSSVKVLLSAVATVWCLKGFRRDQGVADVDWEKGEGRREMGKQSNGGKTNRINRGIKEILIWSERLLIFFPLVWPCAQSLLLVLKQKSVVLRVADSMCFLSVHEFMFFVWPIAVTYVFAYNQRAVSWEGECVVWNLWLVRDVGIRKRLEQWLHNVFALMIPTVCSSYQLNCTGFHEYPDMR